MGLLDNDNYTPRYTPPKNKKVYNSEHDKQTEEKKLEELNNMDRGEVTQDFGDSNFADRQ
jgi:hypothetical protein